MVNWLYYPKSNKPTPLALSIVGAFEVVAPLVDSTKHDHSSNYVLCELEPHLTKLGFRVETSKSVEDRIRVPVLYGLNGRLEKSFDADAYHETEGFVLEVEAGRGVANNQFLKDLFQACMMHNVAGLGIAVRNVYRKNKDFEHVVRFFNTLYASNRLNLPLEGLLVIGY